MTVGNGDGNSVVAGDVVPRNGSGDGNPILIYAVVAEADRRYLDRLKMHLAMPIKKGALRIVDDRDIRPGALTADARWRWCQEARVILYFVSADLFSCGIDLDALVDNHKQARHIPVMVRNAYGLQDYAIGSKVKLPRSGGCLSDQGEIDSRCTEVAKDLRATLGV